VNAGHSLRRFGLLQATSFDRKVRLLTVAIEEFFVTSTSAFEDGLEVAKPMTREKEE